MNTALAFLQISFLLLASGYSCNSGKTKTAQEDLFSSTAFTPEKSFTSGAEGPAVDKDGVLYAVNLEREGTVGRVTPKGEYSVFVSLPDSSIGNGIRFDSEGDMLIADYKAHNVLKVSMASKQITVHAHEPGMNQPNDIAIDSKNRLYASDPNWKMNTGRIWRVDPNGNVTLLEDGMGTTNGIEVSPDERTLYVNESVQRKVWAYNLSAEGTISNKRLLTQFPDFGMDGMRCDVDGNLYVTRHGKGTVAKISANGKSLAEVPLLGKSPSNIAFGGSDGRTAYVTLQDKGNIETFRVDKPGREWQMQHNKK